MQIQDFWNELQPLFKGESEQIQEVDLINLKAGSMAQCLNYLFSHSKSCNCRSVLRGTDTSVTLESPHSVVNYVLQKHVSVAMWVSLPALPMLSVFVDYDDEISFGYVRGMWDAVSVLAFFDLIYELKHMSPGSKIRPSVHTFTNDERKMLMKFWQDYDHVVS